MDFLDRLYLNLVFGDDCKEFDPMKILSLKSIGRLMMTAGIALVIMLITIFRYTGMSPYTYYMFALILVSALSFLSYRLIRNIDAYVTCSIFLCMFAAVSDHLILGGFKASSGIYIWFVLALIATFIYFGEKQALNLFIFFILLTAILMLLQFFVFDAKTVPIRLQKIDFHVVNIAGVSAAIYLTLSLYLPVLFDHYNKSQRLNTILEKERAHIEEMNEELEASNRSLVDAMEDLKDAQSMLIQNEKMASLGQLIAGIAHEINTPIGAIKASSGYIYSTLKDSMAELLDKTRALDEDAYSYIIEIINHSVADKAPLLTSERRKIRKKIHAVLEEKGVEDTMSLAGILVEMDLYNEDDFELISRFAASANVKETTDIAYILVSVLKSAYNIGSATERISKIVFALKSFSHYDHTGEFTLSNIYETVDVVLTLYYNQLKTGITIQKDYQEVPQVYCQPDDLNQVWVNIIHNAIQAMNGEGQLTIGIYSEDDHVCVSFTDTGCGIAPESIEKIFSPFYTTKAMGEGSGLGLDISKRIIETHGGRIQVESKLGAGTTFTIILPIKQG